MKALVPIAIILVTAIAVVLGGNAVIGEDSADSGFQVANSPISDACDLEPPTGKDVAFYPLDCIKYHGQPDQTPLGWKRHPECPDDLREEESELCNNGERVYVPDFGPRPPTVMINGQAIELPPEHSFSYGIPSGIWTITVGDSWVTYVNGQFAGTGKDVLRDFQLGPVDAEAIQPILDALERE